MLTKCNRNLTFSERTLTKPREDFLIVLKQAGAGAIGKQYTLLQHNNTSPPSHTGKDRLGNIRQHYLCNGLVPHQHKGAGKRAHNCLSFVDIRLILNFLVNYAEENAILLCGRIPGHKKDDIQLLSSSTTK